jgi:heme-degrading monooxygenase HmoA
VAHEGEPIMKYFIKVRWESSGELTAWAEKDKPWQAETCANELKKFVQNKLKELGGDISDVYVTLDKIDRELT